MPSSNILEIPGTMRDSRFFGRAPKWACQFAVAKAALRGVLVLYNQRLPKRLISTHIPLLRLHGCSCVEGVRAGGEYVPQGVQPAVATQTKDTDDRQQR